MSELIDHIALFLRALPYLPELTYPLVALAALVNGMVAGRVWRKLRAGRGPRDRRRLPARRAPGQAAPWLRRAHGPP